MKYRLLLPVFMIATMVMVSCTGPFTMQNNGETIEFAEGSPFQVQLEGNPSTGYEWVVMPYNTSVIEMVGAPGFEADNPGLTGSGGMYTFNFKAVSSKFS